MLVQAANLFDLSILTQLEKLCFPQDAWPLLDLISCLSFPGVLRYKAVVDGKMIGFVAVDDRGDSRVAWVATLCVHPDHQGNGYAKAMLDTVEAKTRAPYLRLCVRPTNTPAIRLYQSRGYTQIDSWHNYYNDGSEAIVMEKLLHDPHKGL